MVGLRVCSLFLFAAALRTVALLRSGAPGAGDGDIAPAVGALHTLSVRCGDHTYQYVLSAPSEKGNRPALMLLHGAGGQAHDLVDEWQPLATTEGVVLIAPQLPRELWFEAEAPSVFRCIVADAQRHAAIDATRIYLFGYSMGGYLAFDGAMYASDFFAAVAEYAAAIAPGYETIVTHATRKVPIAMYIGTQDQYYPVALARRTQDLLSSDGFPVHYVEFAGQDHSYAPIAYQLQRDAWTFLSGYHLSR